MGAIASLSTPQALDAQLKDETKLYAMVLGAAGIGAK